MDEWERSKHWARSDYLLYHPVIQCAIELCCSRHEVAYFEAAWL